MAIKVYSAPKCLQPEPYDFKNFNRDEYNKYQNDYIESVKKFCEENGSGKLKGELVTFTVGDGQAVYMIFSSKPTKLIHLDLSDGYHYPHIERLTLSDIKQNLRLKEIFG